MGHVRSDKPGEQHPEGDAQDRESRFAGPGESAERWRVPVFPARNVVRGVDPAPRVLLVDDEPRVAPALARTLGMCGVRVTFRTSGLSALALLREQPDAYDALLTDVHMPHMDGITLGLEVRRLCPRFPVLLISAHIDDRIERLFALHEFDALIPKPASAEDLLQQLGDVLRERAFRAPAGT